VKDSGEESPHRPSPLTRSEAGGFWSIILGVFAAGVASKALITFSRSLNSDDSQPAVVFYDILANHNYMLKNWYVVTNSHLLTEFPLYFILGLAFGMGPLTIKLGAFVVFASSVLLVSIVAYRVSGPRAAALTAAAMSSTALPTHIILHTYVHVGIIAFSLLSLLIVMGMVGPEEKGTRGRLGMLLILFVVSLAAVFSNPFFVFTFVVPASLSYVIVGVLNVRPMRVKSGIILILSLLVASVAGIMLQGKAAVFGLNISSLPTEHVRAGQLTRNVLLYLEYLALLFDMDISGGWSGPTEAFFRLISLCLFLMMGVSAVVIIKKEISPMKRFTCLYFLLAAGVLSISFLMKSVTAPRYLTPIIYSWAFFLSLAVGGTYFAGRRFRYLLLALFMLLAVNNIYKGFVFTEPQFLMGTAGRLEAEGLTYGYSGFWDSNLITLLTENRVKVRSVEFAGYSLMPYFWASNADWYKPSMHEGPTFLMVSEMEKGYGFEKLRPDLVAQMFGRPERTLRHGDAWIYVWPYNIMKATLPSVEISEKTPHSTGRLMRTPMGNVLHAGRGEKGLLVYGRQWTLGRGSYRVRFLMLAKGGPGEEVARIDVQKKDVAAKRYEPENITESITAVESPGWQEYYIDFSVEENRRDIMYEFRVFTTGNGDVTVRKISIETL
jgi:hypothetical protein